MTEGEIERDKIAILAEAFANIVRLEEHGGSKNDSSIEVGLHYLTLANSITSRIKYATNTLYRLVSKKGIEIIIIKGKPNKEITVKIKNYQLVWKR